MFSCTGTLMALNLATRRYQPVILQWGVLLLKHLWMVMGFKTPRQHLLKYTIFYWVPDLLWDCWFICLHWLKTICNFLLSEKKKNGNIDYFNGDVYIFFLMNKYNLIIYIVFYKSNITVYRLVSVDTQCFVLGIKCY